MDSKDYKSIITPIKKAEYEENISKIKNPYIVAAQSQIISRNLSHTDGSHVMPTYDILYEQMLSNIDSLLLDSIKDHLKDSQHIENFKNSLLETTENLICSFKLFNKYLKEVMEYSADVSGGIASQILFSSSVETIFQEFQNLLNTFLGKGLLDDTRVNSEFKSVKLFGLEDINRELEIDFPGGRTGIIALLSILKNYIRNCHKHARNPNNTYDVKMIIKEPKQKKIKHNYWEITLFETKNKKPFNIKRRDVKRINRHHINASILNEKNNIRSNGWGILEMKIAAAYLVKFPLEELDAKSCNGFISLKDRNFPHILKAIVCDGEGQELKKDNEQISHLGYRFYLLKPKTCLVLSDILNLTPKRKQIFESKGFSFENRNFNPTQSSHKFVLKLDGNELKYLNKANIRTIYDSGLFKSLLQKKFPDDVLHELWKHWIEHCSFSNKEKEIVVAKAKKEILDESKDLSKYILFDNHGQQIFFKSINFAHAKFIDLKGKFFYYESFNTTSKVGRVLKKAFSTLNTNSTYFQLMESVYTKVAIIDERIQEKVDGTKTNKNRDSNQPEMTIRELLDLSGIFIPAIPSYNREQRPYPKKEIYSIKDYSNWTPDFFESKLKYYSSEKKCKYIVLHLTIFETTFDKIIENNPKIKSENYLNKLKKILGNCTLIFTSGKGTPKNLPKGSYFISLATLEQFIAINRNKFELVNQLKSLRKITLDHEK